MNIHNLNSNFTKFHWVVILLPGKLNLKSNDMFSLVKRILYLYSTKKSNKKLITEIIQIHKLRFHIKKIIIG
jgi:hypothetical protein